MENLKNTFILWKYKDNKTYNKSYVQDIVETHQGKNIIELSDGDWHTRYPTRIEIQMMDILTIKTK